MSKIVDFTNINTGNQVSKPANVVDFTVINGGGITELSQCFDAQNACSSQQIMEINMLINDIKGIKDKFASNEGLFGEQTFYIDELKPIEIEANKVIDSLNYTLLDLSEARRQYKLRFWQRRIRDLRELIANCDTNISALSFAVETELERGQLAARRQVWIDKKAQAAAELAHATEKLNLYSRG